MMPFRSKTHRIACLAALLSTAAAQPLPNTAPLTLSGDPARQMVDGIHAYLKRTVAESVGARKPERERLKYILGATDARVPFDAPALVATTAVPAKLAQNADYTVYAVRWPVLDGVHGEGLLFEPAAAPVYRVVALPDADGSPEQFTPAFRLAENGCQVLAPALIDRADTYSGNPRFRMTNQPHREYLYRMGFPVGCHPIGYDAQKAMAAVDWFAAQPFAIRPGGARIGIWGYGEGGLVALHTAALDTRIATAVVSGYFQSRQNLWQEPIYRNVWGLLRDFGDAELAAMAAPRRVIVETRPGPKVTGPPSGDSQRRGGAPGAIDGPTAEAALAEVDRARALGANVDAAPDAMAAFLRALGVAHPKAAHDIPKLTPPAGRMRRQVEELVEYTQKLVRLSEARRDEYWSKADTRSPEKWVSSTKLYRERLWDDVIGRLPKPAVPLNPRTRHAYQDAKWDGYEVTLDVQPDVFAYGVLLVPKGIRSGERRPVVVYQHGLDGRPQMLFSRPAKDKDGDRFSDYHYYGNVGSRLADDGFVVFMPQNPYVGGDHFRNIQRLGNPVGLSMFSFILAQNERLLDWLESLPFVDHARIGFYGLSYGGKTALRVPALLDRYALSICAGDFNEWIVKLTTTEAVYTYMFTPEWEIGEWNLGHVANHAEMAKLIAPRPFMVERGHRDGVGVDEWVSYEYAKVRRFYDEMGLGDRTTIEYFNGPHMVHGVGTIEFLKRHLRWPTK